MTEESNRPAPGFQGGFLLLFLLTPIAACHIYETESFRRLCLSVAGASLAVAWIAHAATRGSVLWPSGPIAWIVAALSLCHILQAFRSLNPYSAVTGLTLDLACASVAFALAAHAPWRSALLRFLPGVVCVVAGLIALAGIWQWLDFIPTDCLGRVSKGYAPSLFGHGNNGGTFAGMFIPLVVAAAVSSQGSARRVLTWLCVSLLACYIVLSHSRAGLLAAVVSSIVFFFATKPAAFVRLREGSRARRVLVGAGMLVLTVCALAVVVMQDKGDDWVDHAVSTGSMNDRLSMWRNALQISADHPVAGVGLGNFRAACYPYRAPVELNRRTTREESHFFGLGSPHNMYVLLLAEEGFPTVLLFLAAAGAALWNYGRRLGALTDETEAVWLAALASALVGFGIGGVFNSLSMSVAQSVFAWMAIGVLAGTGRETRSVTGVRAGASAIAAAGLLVFFAAAALVHGRFIQGRAGELEFMLQGNRGRALLEQAVVDDPWNPNLRWRAGRMYLQSNEFEQAAKEYRQILAWEPQNPHAHLNLGEALRGQEQFEAAAASFRASIQLAPKWPLNRQALAFMAADREDHTTADEQFRVLIELDPRWPHYRYYHGLVCAARGDYDEAAVRFREARDRGWPIRKSLREKKDSWLALPQFQEFLR